MRPVSSVRRAVQTVLLTAIPALLAWPVPGTAETVIPVGAFRSVTLRGGGDVVLRHGHTPRVTLLQGTTDVTVPRIEDGDHLVIERCQDRCPERYRMIVEVVAPNLDAIRVMDGGTIQTRGTFPSQSEVSVAVHDGGTIDLRSMAVDVVTARVRQGGRILTRPREALAAKVAQGGAVTYWGSPRVTSSVDHGGVVARGVAADAHRPLPEMSHTHDVVPPVPSRRVRGTF